MSHSCRALALAGILAAAIVLPARAWWTGGHSTIAIAAVKALPADVPAFFRGGSGQVGHCAQDPDVIKNPGAPLIREREEPEHFIDFELLKGAELPRTRYEYERLCVARKLDPRVVGFVPYSVGEWTERLAIAFAEHRKWPENPYIPPKCLVYAGILAHYSGDMCQPLHVTVDYDGRCRADGTSPHAGIHAAVDSLIDKLGLKPEDLARDQKVEAAADLFPAIVRELNQTRSHVDQTYALEGKLPPRSGQWTPGPEAAAFTRERARESVRFTASLYLTAWRSSARIIIPTFVEREK
jgi:hypothetical protein